MHDASEQTNRQDSIANRAHDKWVRRGQANHLADWLDAEAEMHDRSELTRRIAELECQVQALTTRPAHRRLAEAESRLGDLTVELKRADKRLTVEHAVYGLLANSLDFTDVAAPLLQAIGAGLDWNAGALWMVDDNRRALRCVECWHTAMVNAGELEQFNRQCLVERGTGLAERIWAEGALWVSQVACDAGVPKTADAARNGLYGCAGFPICVDDQVVGVMEFFSREVRQLDAALFETMRAIARGISEFVARRRDADLLREHQRESRVALRIQEALLPKFVPKEAAGFSIAGRSSPSHVVGGDYFDFFPMMDRRLAVMIGDASGHGVAAALMIAETRAYVRAHASTTTNLNAILTRTNRGLVEDLPCGSFVTLLLVRFDPDASSAICAGAGHCPGYVMDCTGRIKAHLGSQGRPLGLESGSEFPAGPAISLAMDDIILLYTDGIVEAGSSGAAGLFGINRALSVVEEHRHQTPEEILEALFRAVGDFAQPEGQGDDATAVVIKVGACGQSFRQTAGALSDGKDPSHV